MADAKFIQIECSESEEDHSLFALDENGQVWEYQFRDVTCVANRSNTHKRGWHPLSMRRLPESDDA